MTTIYEFAVSTILQPFQAGSLQLTVVVAAAVALVYTGLAGRPRSRSLLR